jgi:predicted acyl esterase
MAVTEKTRSSAEGFQENSVSQAVDSLLYERRGEGTCFSHGNRNTLYFLTADGALTVAKPPVGSEPLTYDFDPQHPVPTMGAP